MALDKESVESSWSCITNSSSVQNQPQSPFQSPNSGGNRVTLNYSPQQQKQQQNRKFSPVEDACYRCKKLGHWAKNCPNGTGKEQPSISRSQPFLAFDECEPKILCKCGATARSHTSRSEKNPNRQYYKCPEKCGFIKWVDKVEPEEMIYVPMCKCNAGFCRLSVERSGPNAGRKSLICPIKKGQGACEFLQWLDETRVTTPINGDVAADEIINSSPPTLTNCDDNSSPASSSDLVHQAHFTQKELEIESPVTVPVPVVVDTPSPPPPPGPPQNYGSVSGLSKRTKTTTSVYEFEGDDDASTDEQPLRKHHKRLRHWVPKIDPSLLYFDTQCLEEDTPTDRLLTEELHATMVLRSEAEINYTQLEFSRHIIQGLPGPSVSYGSCSSSWDSNSVLPREHCLLTTAMVQNLGFHVGDWLGRLQFSPSRGLMIPAPKLHFCCVFPSFNPIFVPQNEDKFEPGIDSDLLSVVVNWEPSTRVVGRSSSVMRDSIFESFGEVAVKLQNKLLSLLESMDFHNQKSMVEEARTTFHALDRLTSVNIQPFRKRVKDFIDRASSLAKLERSIFNDCSSKELVEWYNREKKRFDDVYRDHAKAIVDLEASKRRIKMLDQRAASVRDTLFQIEAELSCCVDEKQDLESKFAEISKAKAESEVGFQFASKAAGGALKLYQQMEEDRVAAEAAFKKAKFLLRQ